MPDLESSIRDALQSRSDSTVVLETSLRDRPRRSFAPLLAAAVVLLLALATAAVATNRGDDSKAPPANGGAGFVGFDWQLVKIRDAAGELAVPQAKGGRLSFPSATSIEGSDTVNGLTGSMRVTDRGFRVVRYGSTFVAPPPGDRVVKAVDAIFQATGGVTAEVDGDTLTVQVSGTTVTLVRLGVSTRPTSTPSSTPAPAGPLGMVGYRWNLVGFTDATGARSVEGADAYLSFPSVTSIQGDDTLNGLQGTMRISGDGFTVSDVMGGGVGSTGTSRVAEAMDAVFAGGRRVTVSIKGDALTLSAGDVTLTLTKGATVAPDTTDPSPTGSASHS